jgi:hypothetical protein
MSHEVNKYSVEIESSLLSNATNGLSIALPSQE